MSFVNVGASDRTGRRFPSKKALKTALLDDPGSVEFDKTSMFDGAGVIAGNAIPAGVTLSVVGPDPYTSRKWYASVKAVNGTVRVT